MTLCSDKSTETHRNDKNSFFDLSASELIGLFIKNKKTLLAAPLITTVIAACLAYSLPEQYVATLQVPPSKNAGVFAWVLGNEQFRLNLIRSEKLAERFHSVGKNETLQKLDKKLKIEVNAKDKDAVSISVSFMDSDPEFAAQFVNKLGAEMQHAVVSMSLLESTKTEAELQDKIKVARTKLDEFRKKAAEPGVAASIQKIAPAERFVIESLSALQVDQDVSKVGSASLEQDAIARLQNQLFLLQNQIQQADSGWKKDPAATIATINNIQQQSYWTGVIEKLIAKIEVVKRQQSDELKLVNADIPDFSTTSQKRPVIIFATYFLTLLIVSLALIAREALVFSNAKK